MSLLNDRPKQAMMELKRFMSDSSLGGKTIEQKEIMLHFLCREYQITKEDLLDQLFLDKFKDLKEEFLNQLDQIATCPNGDAMAKKLTTPFPMD